MLLPADLPAPFHYEPMPTLRASTTLQLWVLGGDDLESPSAETAKRIKSLIAQGKSYTLAVYPRAEHGMTEYELNAKGERVSTRFAPGCMRCSFRRQQALRPVNA
jgi:uncharacterized protein